jgi:hypothetical protein
VERKEAPVITFRDENHLRQGHLKGTPYLLPNHTVKIFGWGGVSCVKQCVKQFLPLYIFVMITHTDFIFIIFDSVRICTSRVQPCNSVRPTGVIVFFVIIS